MISRTVYGAPDELFISPNLRPFQEMSNKKDYDIFGGVAYEGNTNENIKFDTEYDIYSYNFNSESGKFIFKSGEVIDPVFFPAKPLKIVSSTPFPNNIVDEKGVAYDFGFYEKALQGSFSVITGAYLTKISSVNKKDDITLSYEGFTKIRTSPSELWTISDDFVLDGQGSESPPGSINKSSIVGRNGISSTQNSNSYSTYFVTGITFKEGSIVFNYEESSNRLQSIVVLNKVGNIIKTIQFERSVLDRSPILNENNYKLDGVLFKDSDGRVVNKFSFDYHPSRNFGPGNKDHWGFVNDNEFRLIPYHDIYFSDPPVSGGSLTIGHNSVRESNPEVMRSGMLKKITYPTGGTTEFVFEGNRIKTGNQELNYCGLRIQQIKNFDNRGNVDIKTYKYPVPGTAPFYPNVYAKSKEIRTLLGVDYLGNDGGSRFSDLSYRTRYYSSEIPAELSYLTQQPVFYREVIEYYGTESENNGKTEYVYEGSHVGSIGVYNAPVFPVNGSDGGELTVKNAIVDNSILPHFVSEYNFWNKRSILTTKHFENSGKDANGKIIYTIKKGVYNRYRDTETSKLRGLHVYKYCQLLPDSRGTTILKEREKLAATRLNLPIFLFADYFISVGKKELISTEEIDYSATGDIVKRMEYSYNLHNLINETVTVKSNGSSAVVQLKYPFDNTSEAVHQNMINKNMLDYVVEQHEFKNTIPIKSTKTLYKDWGNNNILPHIVYQKNGNNGYEEKLIFNSYDESGNLLQVSRAANYPISYSWGYDKIYPTVEIKNATSSQYYHTSFEDNGTKVDINNSAVTGVKFLNSGTFTVPFSPPVNDGLTYIMSYWYMDSDGKWKFSGEVPYSRSISRGTKLDEVRVFPKGAEMTTFTYEPMIGITSANNSNSSPSYYLYDKFGRLSAISDNNRNIVKSFTYNIVNPSFFNTEQSREFTKNDCTQEYVGSKVMYLVPAGIYSSSESQSDADNKAINEINAKGQVYANLKGNCFQYLSREKNRVFIKNDCSEGYLGSEVNYTVNNGKYKSAISQEDADLKAENDLNQNGQVFANNNGSCRENIIYRNVQIRKFFKKTCSFGFEGSMVEYIIPVGKYTSTYSQDEANAKAQFDLDNYGPSNANTYGYCTPIQNVSVSVYNNSYYDAVLTYSNSTGSATFNVPKGGSTLINVPNGTYNLSITLPGNTSYNFSFEAHTSTIRGKEAQFQNVVPGSVRIY